jgi:hypothetical protein
MAGRQVQIDQGSVEFTLQCTGIHYFSTPSAWEAEILPTRVETSTIPGHLSARIAHITDSTLYV